MIKARTARGYQIENATENLTWMADEPPPVGEDAGPNPYDLLLSALASCTLMTVKMYAKRKGWPLAAAELELSQQHIHAEDCTECETKGAARINLIEGKLVLKGPLDEEQRARLMEIAHRCPVHRTLKMETKIDLSSG